MARAIFDVTLLDTLPSSSFQLPFEKVVFVDDKMVLGFYSDRDTSQELTVCYDWINRIRVRYKYNIRMGEAVTIMKAINISIAWKGSVISFDNDKTSYELSIVLHTKSTHLRCYRKQGMSFCRIYEMGLLIGSQRAHRPSLKKRCRQRYKDLRRRYVDQHGFHTSNNVGTS
uniref:Transposase n=1 Tax=Haemonchus contortus TaxID=6289 RepID=A0A7I5E8P5_HAECO